MWQWISNRLEVSGAPKKIVHPEYTRYGVASLTLQTHGTYATPCVCEVPNVYRDPSRSR